MPNNSNFQLILLIINSLDIHSLVKLTKKEIALSKSLPQKKINYFFEFVALFESNNKIQLLKKIKLYITIMKNENAILKKTQFYKENYYSYQQFIKKFTYYSNKEEFKTQEINFHLALKGLILVEYLLENYDFNQNYC
jgi:hypothetical protein